MSVLKIKNWEKFQHYKERNPPWIKLHQSLLDDLDFYRLQDASKLHLILIWLYASRHDGEVPCDPKFVQTKIGVSTPVDLKALINAGFLVDASNALATCKQVAPPETETETETEKALTDFQSVDARLDAVFDRIWTLVPRKEGRPRARRSVGAFMRRFPKMTDAAVEAHFADGIRNYRASPKFPGQEWKHGSTLIAEIAAGGYESPVTVDAVTSGPDETYVTSGGMPRLRFDEVPQ